MPTATIFFGNYSKADYSNTFFLVTNTSLKLLIKHRYVQISFGGLDAPTRFLFLFKCANKFKTRPFILKYFYKNLLDVIKNICINFYTPLTYLGKAFTSLVTLLTFRNYYKAGTLRNQTHLGGNIKLGHHLL